MKRYPHPIGLDEHSPEGEFLTAELPLCNGIEEDDRRADPAVRERLRSEFGWCPDPDGLHGRAL